MVPHNRMVYIRTFHSSAKKSHSLVRNLKLPNPPLWVLHFSRWIPYSRSQNDILSRYECWPDIWSDKLHAIDVGDTIVYLNVGGIWNERSRV